MANYTPSITVERAREIIMDMDYATAVDTVKRFANVQDADVVGGDVWVENPCTGHWLNDEKLCLLAEGIEAGV